MLKEKTVQFVEMFLVYAAILLILAFAGSIVALGSAVPVKMLLKVLLNVVLAGIPFIICRMRKISFKELGFSRSNIGKQALIALGIFAVIFCLTVLIPLLIGIDKRSVLSYKYPLEILIFYILFDLIVIGFGEEFIYRGYFYNRLGKATNSRLAAVIISSLLFGFSHFPGSQDFLQVATTTGIGLVYGFSRYKIKNCSLLSVSVAHGMQDAGIVILSFFLL